MRAEKIFLFLIILIFGILFLSSLQYSFFWDTVHLASMQASWFYDHHFNQLLLPQEIDSGHPPFLGILLALAWKAGGRNLLVSHLLMLPFLVLMIREAWLLGKDLFGAPYFIWGAALLLFNAILLGQSVLVSPDVLLFAFLFFTIRRIFSRSHWMIILGTCLLSMVSMRGMMCAFACFIFEMIYEGFFLSTFRIRKMIPVVTRYLPAGFLIIAFLSWHYYQTGWIGYHQDSPWGYAFERPDLPGFFRNIIILAWRLMDFGNLFIWLFLGGLIFLFRAGKNLRGSETTRKLACLSLVFLLVLAIPQLFYKHLLSHRYLYPCIAVASLFFYSIAMDNVVYSKLRVAMILVLTGMLTGNLWVYPDPIAQGWDSTLAHLPYYRLRKEAIQFLRQKKIDPAMVGSTFPYDLDAIDLDLSDKPYRLAPKNLDSNQYVLYSNISNDFSKKEIGQLKLNWKVVKEFGGWPVHFILYGNPVRTVE